MNLDLVGAVLVVIGLFFFFAGSVGLLRLPDLHSRLHALTKADNLGLGFLCAGLALLSGDWLIALKLGLIWLLVLAASAVATLLLAEFAASHEQNKPSLLTPSPDNRHQSQQRHKQRTSHD